MNVFLRSASVLALAAAALAANAAVIDFEGHGDDLSLVQTQSGFTFTFTAGGWGIVTDTFAINNAVRNGTTRLVMAGGPNGTAGRASVVVAPVGGAPFSLTGFDAATLFTNQGPGGLQIVGTKSGGATVSATFATVTSFASYTLPSTFSDLIGFVVTDSVSATFRNGPGVSLDNLQIGPANPTPEPSALAALGLGAVAFVKRRKRA